MSRVLSETSRLISAHSCHFLALAALFLVLVSFSTTIYPFLPHPTSLLLSYYHQFLYSFSMPHSEIPPQLIDFLQSLLSPGFNVFLVASTTSSTVHKYHDQAIKLVSSLKSILVSFFPFLSPNLVRVIILGLILFVFGILKLLQYTILVLLGCNMDYNSIYFLVFNFHIAALFAGLLFYLMIAPSEYLVKGMRGVAFLMMMLYRCLCGILSMWYMVMMANYAGNNFHGPTAWLVLPILVFVVLLVTLFHCNQVVETVFIRLLLGEIALCGDSTTSQIGEK